MTDYIVANCEMAEFNGLYEYDVWFGFNDESNMVWIKFDGNGHEIENVIAIIASNLTTYGQPYIDGVSVSDHYANQDTNNQSLTYPDDPSIVWMIGGSDSGDYSNLTVTAASSGTDILTSSDVASASSVSKPAIAQINVLTSTNIESTSSVSKSTIAEFLSGTVDETYLLSAQYFGKFYWPNNAVPEVADVDTTDELTLQIMA